MTPQEQKLECRCQQERRRHELAGWQALARGEFRFFAECVSNWEHVNDFCTQRIPNPFNDLVAIAMVRLGRAEPATDAPQLPPLEPPAIEA